MSKCLKSKKKGILYICNLEGLKSEIKWWRLGANPMQDCCGRLESSKKWKKLVSFIERTGLFVALHDFTKLSL
jgi:hypothetical protein